MFKWIEKEIEYIKKIGGTKKRTKKLMKQFEKKGWTDTETWSLDHSFANWMLPRLKRFRETTCSYPGRDASEKEWYDILDKMIKGFEIMASEDYFAISKENDAIVQEAMYLLAKWYRHLWS